MQDISTASCAATTTGTEAQLEDKRDDNKYWVGKMLDGKCWMLQNLALGSTSSDTVLNSTDSNVASNWSLPTSKTTPAGSSSATAIVSWNFGKWVLATPLLTTGCGNSVAGGQTISNCVKVGFVDVSSSSFQPTYTATTRSWEGANATSSTLTAVNCTSWSGSGTSKICTAGTYDPHYLVGNYYSWNAATAGSGENTASGEASSSICPKGWKLPISNTTSIGSFVGLLSRYGVDSNVSGTGTDGRAYDIAGVPLRFVRSGYVDSNDNYVNTAGRGGMYWSSTVGTGSGSAYRMYFSVSSTASDVAYRRFGFSVRCVSQ